jgi:hypothetical protein
MSNIWRPIRKVEDNQLTLFYHGSKGNVWMILWTGVFWTIDNRYV